MLYGFGDGGGGPHKPMLDRLKRLKVDHEQNNLSVVKENNSWENLRMLMGSPKWKIQRQTNFLST